MWKKMRFTEYDRTEINAFAFENKCQRLSTSYKITCEPLSSNYGNNLFSTGLEYKFIWWLWLIIEENYAFLGILERQNVF